MKLLSCTKLETSSFFDLETYLALSGQKGIDSESARQVERTWQEILPQLKAYRLGERRGYLLFYLDQGFEAEVDRLWKESPSDSYRLQGIGQALLMTNVGEILPEAGMAGCAPVPKPNKVLRRSLEEIGLSFSNQGTLSVKYGIITVWPYRGGCETCFLRDSCPKYQLSTGQSQ
jgi:hypothetical protein